jgi:hypothetical protein
MNSMQNEASVTQKNVQENVKEEILPQSNVQHKNRRILLLVVAVFVLPILLAKFALNGDWLATGVTNKGTLLTNELTLDRLGIDNDTFSEQWLIIYSLPISCDLDCQKTLEAVHNTYVALGKEMPRVTPVALYQNELSTEQLQRISKSKWQLMPTPVQAKEQIKTPQVLIVDPLGNVVLSHQIPDSSGQLPQFGKQILADMKKLLKYSKVG